jgi:hypothetical protein
MAQANGLNWAQTPEGWQVEIDEPAEVSEFDKHYAGARYQIREHGSPAVFELRWMWVPMFEHEPPAERGEFVRRFREFHWTNPYLVRSFNSLDEAMRFADDQEKHRLTPSHAKPPGALASLRYEFDCNFDGDRWLVVRDKEVDMTGWKIETIEAGLGTRELCEFKKKSEWPFENRWSALCDWRNSIVRWIPPGGDAI